MYKNRAIETVITNTIEQFPILLLTGPRQVGKTTVLKHILGEDYRYVTMDDPIQRQSLKDDPALFLKNNPGKLILDEIQYVPESFSYLKMRVDESQKTGQFVLTGSQVFNMMQGVSETLAGRVGILELQGLSMREICDVPFKQPFIPTESYLEEREKHLKSYEPIWQHIHRGAMPRLALNPDINWEIYYRSYLQTYLERDVCQLTQVADENLFTKFMVALAARSGELLNYQSIAKDLSVSSDTVKRWISVLESSRIIYLLQPYANNHLKRAIKTPKLYFLDTGLLAYLTMWLTPETLSKGAVNGAVFETFVVSEIIKSFINAGTTRLPLFFYRDRDKREIDLLIELGDSLYPIEIKHGANPNASMVKHFSALDAIPGKKVENGIILCRYERKMWLKENLVALPIEYI